MSDGTAASSAAPVTASTRKRRLTIASYAVVTSLYWTALYLYVPTLPTHIESKTGSLATVGLVLSMYGLWQAFIRLPFGIVADWLGWRKPLIVLGLVLTGLGAWVMGGAEGANGLMLGRAITGLAAGTWVLLVATFSSLYPAKEAVRATTTLQFIASLSRVVATSVTGSLNILGGYSLAFKLAAAAAASAILIAIPIPEKRRPIKRPSVGGIGRLVSRRDVLVPALLSALMQYASWATVLGFVPILASQLGATDVTLSLLTGMGMLVITVGNLVATTIVGRIGARRLASISFMGLGVGIAIAALAPSLPVVFVAQFVIALVIGTCLPVLMGMSIRHVDDAERTTAMGLHQAVYATGMFSGPWLSGLLSNAFGIRAAFGITALMCGVLGPLGVRRFLRDGE